MFNQDKHVREIDERIEALNRLLAGHLRLLDRGEP